MRPMPAMNDVLESMRAAAFRRAGGNRRADPVGGQFLKLAEEAIQQQQGHVAFLEVLLRTELEPAVNASG